jgi:hypothetical protein
MKLKYNVTEQGNVSVQKLYPIIPKDTDTGRFLPVKGRSTVPSRKGLYARLAKYSPKAIKVLVKLLHSENETTRLNAAKALLAKTVPDLKETDQHIDGGIMSAIKIVQYGLHDPIQLQPQGIKPSGLTSDGTPLPLPGTQLAPQSEKDNPSPQPTNQTRSNV